MKDVWEPLGGKDYLSYVIGAYGFRQINSTYHYSKGLAHYKGVCELGGFSKKQLIIIYTVRDMGEFHLTVKNYKHILSNLWASKIFFTEWVIIYKRWGMRTEIRSCCSEKDIAKAVEEVLGCDLLLGRP